VKAEPKRPRARPLTDRFDRALLYATHVHGGQVRKRITVPYVAHFLAVAATVLEYGGDEDMAIGARLHDAAEDQGRSARLQDIRNRFGDRVANFVGACSDSLANTAAGEKKAGWQERKEKYLAHLPELDADTLFADTLLISKADKVHNARSILRDLRKHDVGAAVWSRFSTSREGSLWYYGELAKVFQRVLPGQLSDELADIARALKT
jgi:(p)ppGpp synthase/HD superfamily hydrolase